MPSRNRVKVYAPESYYHVYNRGLNKEIIFREQDDYAVFLNLLKRYLSKEPAKDNKGRVYESMYGQMELLAFCLMPNHFHLLIYQNDLDAITNLIRRISTSYVRYFNKKYKRSGPLFEERFKGSLINRDEYLLHISRYIHLNPRSFKDWAFSSLPYYLGARKADWIMPQRILELFEGDNYLNFVNDYKDHKKMLDEIKSELANNLN